MLAEERGIVSESVGLKNTKKKIKETLAKRLTLAVKTELPAVTAETR